MGCTIPKEPNSIYTEFCSFYIVKSSYKVTLESTCFKMSCLELGRDAWIFVRKPGRQFFKDSWPKRLLNRIHLPGIQTSHLKSCQEDYFGTLYQGYQHSIVQPFWYKNKIIRDSTLICLTLISALKTIRYNDVS